LAGGRFAAGTAVEAAPIYGLIGVAALLTETGSDGLSLISHGAGRGCFSDKCTYIYPKNNPFKCYLAGLARYCGLFGQGLSSQLHRLHTYFFWAN
jgi:hypothetical protein